MPTTVCYWGAMTEEERWSIGTEASDRDYLQTAPVEYTFDAQNEGVVRRHWVDQAAAESWVQYCQTHPNLVSISIDPA